MEHARLLEKLKGPREQLEMLLKLEPGVLGLGTRGTARNLMEVIDVLEEVITELKNLKIMSIF